MIARPIRTSPSSRPPGRRISRPGIILGLVIVVGGGGALLTLDPPESWRDIIRVLYDDRAPDGIWFENVTDQCGIDFQHVSGHDGTFYFPEIMSGGAGLIDYDRDGDLDVYLVQGGRVVDPPPTVPTNKLYRNLGNGTFEDVTDEAGVGDTGYGMACIAGDFNNDGWPDLYVTNCGPNVLYQNNGDGTFTDVTTTARVGHPTYSGAAAFVDYDYDGHLDLFLTNYVNWTRETEIECRDLDGRLDYCNPANYGAPGPDVLYHNNGDGTFSDVTRAAGVSSMFGTGVGVVCGDFNGDGLIDLSVANDGMANQLWLNQGDGTFREEALIHGVAYSGHGVTEASMGIDAQDIDDDGDLDIIMGHYAAETTTLYINHGDYFEDESLRFGLAATRPYTSFALAMVDLDNDGDLDLYSANGRAVLGPVETPADDPYAQPNQLFRRLPDGTFAEVTPRGGLAGNLVHTSRAAAFGDYDNDGDIDIIILNKDAPTYVLRNRTDGRNHWITFHITNRHGSNALGAQIRLKVGDKTRYGRVRVSYSYFASNDPRVHFGLGSETQVKDVQVTWPDGTTQHYANFTADQFVKLKPTP